MNLMLHHFRKEFRWLWPRWVVLLTALGLDLAYNMEWVFPMKAGDVMGISELVSAVLWLVGWWVMLSTAPEDNAQAFVLTRPLSRRSYWLARLMVWALLVVLPFVIETGVYLALMHRPWGDIWTGMVEEALAASAMTLWVLPAAALFHGWERYLALVVFAALWGAEYGRDLLGHFYKLIHVEPQLTFPFFEPVRFLEAAWLVGPLMVVLLLWHRHRPLSLLKRLSALAVLALVAYGLAVSPLIHSRFEAPQNVALAQKLGGGRQPAVMPVDFQMDTYVDEKRGPLMRVHPSAALDGVPRGIIPIWSNVETTITQNGRKLPLVPSTNVEGYLNPQMLGFTVHFTPLAGDLAAPAPADLLCTDASQPHHRLRPLQLPAPKDLTTPVDFDMKLAASWVQLRELGQAPLKAGACIRSPEAELEVIAVRAHWDGRGSRKPGAVTLTVRQSMRTLSWRHTWWPVGPKIMLLAPGKRLTWQNAMQSSSDWRSLRLGWVHSVVSYTFQDVLRDGSGVTEANLDQQQIQWIKPDYLGTTFHHAEVKSMRLSEYLQPSDAWPYTRNATHQEANPREAFLAHILRLPRPDPAGPREEIARYVANVCSASRAYENRDDLNQFSEPFWPGDDHQFGELLAPYIVKHPDLITQLKAPEVFVVMGAALLKAGIPGFHQEADAEQPSYQRVVAVSGQPGVSQSLVSKPWVPFGTVERDRLDVAVMQMLKTGSDEALRPLILHEPQSLEKIWQAFPGAINGVNLRVLVRDSRYREKAIGETRRQYAMLARTVKPGRRKEVDTIAAMAVLGEAEALDWLLRLASFQREDGQNWLNACLRDVHQAIFDIELAPREVGAFIVNCRRWKPADFRYDAEKMCWELRENPAANSKKP